MHLATTVSALDVDASMVAARVAAMSEMQYAKASSCSAMRTMNQFSKLA